MNAPENLRRQMLAELEGELQSGLEAIRAGQAPDLADLIAYHMGWEGKQSSGGKRIRPLLSMLCCSAAGGDWRAALPAAAAVEWLHNFSLVHDDIEDQSRTRRGRETLWSRIGVPLAINTGDAIFALARLSSYRLLDEGFDADRSLEVQRSLDQTALELCQGQHEDMRFEQQASVTADQYLAMIAGKTGSLIACACRIGARLSPAGEHVLQSYTAFGYNLGLAFQVQDDILGVWGKPEQTGKPAGDDLLRRKKTLPVLYGLERASGFRELWERNGTAGDIRPLVAALDEQGILEAVQAKADEFSSEAHSALEQAEPADPAGTLLEELLHSLLRRES